MVEYDLTADWSGIEEHLGSAAALDASARSSGALKRRRAIRDGSSLLRLCFGYGSGLSLREAAAWAGMSGIGQLSDVAVLKRLRGAGDWLSQLAGGLVADRLPDTTGTVRIVDGTTVSDPDGRLWRLHAAYDLAEKRFSHVELSDRHSAEKLERAPVVDGEIRIGDRCYARPEGLRHMVAQGANFVVRVGWKSLLLRDGDGGALDLASLLAQAEHAAVDVPVQVLNGRKRSLTPIPARLVIVRKPPESAAFNRKRAAHASRRNGHVVQQATLDAADHLMLVTSLPPSSHTTDQIIALYRLRWQIELAFKRLKSLLDFDKLPARDAALARTWLLAKLLLAMIIEDLGNQVLDSPPSASALSA